MILIPAIDLYDGKCVRLHKGDFNKMKSYSDDPVEMAKHFEAVGCTHLHVVDLEGARNGRVIQTSTLASIASSTNPMKTLKKYWSQVRKSLPQAALLFTTNQELLIG
jgi:phosphoribosylformimino-5-aminoimidazole carboxamide ribonucleotide (ProFAR) isomerase